MPSDPTNLAEIKRATPGVYDRHARAWHEGRDTSRYEASWLARLFAGHGAPCRVLDLGCGSGRPLADMILEQGHDLTGIDSSPAMIALAQTHYPQATWQVMDIRDLTLPGPFDAVLSWDGFFHLSPAEQRMALPRLAALTGTGGALLLTVGHRAGEDTGTIQNELVYHGSLDVSEYESLLKEAGFAEVTLFLNEPTAWGRCVLLARNRQARPTD